MEITSQENIIFREGQITVKETGDNGVKSIILILLVKSTLSKQYRKLAFT